MLFHLAHQAESRNVQLNYITNILITQAVFQHLYFQLKCHLTSHSLHLPPATSATLSYFNAKVSELMGKCITNNTDEVHAHAHAHRDIYKHMHMFKYTKAVHN